MARPVTILLVEDNPADARLTELALKNADPSIEVRLADNGLEALRYLRGEGEHEGSERPDLILLDLNLPGVSGHEVLEKVRGDAATRDIPVLIFSSSDAESDVRTSYELHANCYITKPIEFERFTEVMSLVKRFWLDSSVRLPGRS